MIKTFHKTEYNMYTFKLKFIYQKPKATSNLILKHKTQECLGVSLGMSLFMVGGGGSDE